MHGTEYAAQGPGEPLGEFADAAPTEPIHVRDQLHVIFFAVVAIFLDVDALLLPGGRWVVYAIDCCFSNRRRRGLRAGGGLL